MSSLISECKDTKCVIIITLDRESAWGCVCDPGLWSFTLQPRYKRPQHKNTVTHTHRTRMQKESAIKDSRNTFKHFIMLAMQVLWVCVCVRHVPAHVSGRLWGCVGGWMERSGRALASSCYHIRSHPNLSARPEREREREISLWSWTFTDCRAVTKISCHPLRLRKRHYR